MSRRNQNPSRSDHSHHHHNKDRQDREDISRFQIDKSDRKFPKDKTYNGFVEYVNEMNRDYVKKGFNKIVHKKLVGRRVYRPFNGMTEGSEVRMSGPQFANLQQNILAGCFDRPAEEEEEKEKRRPKRK